MGTFHTDFGANAVALKFWHNGSVGTSGTMDGFVPVKGRGGGANGPCPPGWKNKTKYHKNKVKMNWPGPKNSGPNLRSFWFLVGGALGLIALHFLSGKFSY